MRLFAADKTLEKQQKRLDCQEELGILLEMMLNGVV
jgi:hypothetical protein